MILHRFLFLFLSLAITAFIFMIASSETYAQRHPGYCDHAESTADALDCVNRHKNDVQERLNYVYKEINDANLSGKEDSDLLAEAQQSWLPYRDAQCAWEAGLAENPSLERIYELSCITLLTNMRTELLAMSMERADENTPREFGSQPRWMNVLSHDYPDVFWRVEKWLKADFDCDGQDEQIMTGVSIRAQEIDIVLAVTENPLTGKPKAKLLSLPVSDQPNPDNEPLSDDPFICGANVDLHIIKHPDNKENKDEEAPRCQKALKITDHLCKPVILYWSGEDYSLKHQEATGG